MRSTRAASIAGRGGAATAVFVALAAMGALVPGNLESALVAALGLLIAGLCLAQPAALPVLALPALVVVERAGSGSVDLSISDLALFAAFWPAVFLSPRPFSPPMRAILWLSAFYQLSTLLTVIANVYSENTIEWFHAWLSVAGALVVGWAIGRAGRARLALNLFLLACAAIAALTLVQAATQLASGDAGPVFLEWPFSMHKNFLGTVLGFAAVVAYARPSWVGWTTRWAMSGFVLFTMGVLASQARQALVGLLVAVAVIALRPDAERRRSKVVLLAVPPAAFFVWSLIQDQLAEGNEFNSAFQRLTWYQQALEVWATSPWFGVGLRWWTAGRTPYGFQPPNAELEVLSSAGVAGLLGFLVLFVGALVVLWRVDPRYGTLAFALVLARVVQGQFDLFWSAVVVSVPFVVAGLCLGAQARSAAEGTSDVDLGSSSGRQAPAWRDGTHLDRGDQDRRATSLP